jgi:hypothetical protein
MGWTTDWAACLVIVRRSFPAGTSRFMLRRARPVSMPSNAGRSVLSSSSPASVAATLRVVRDSSRTPSRCSSAFMAWLSADWDMPSLTAARVKLPSSATTVNADKSSSSLLRIHAPAS